MYLIFMGKWTMLSWSQKYQNEWENRGLLWEAAIYSTIHGKIKETQCTYYFQKCISNSLFLQLAFSSMKFVNNLERSFIIVSSWVIFWMQMGQTVEVWEWHPMCRPPIHIIEWCLPLQFLCPSWKGNINPK